MKFNQFIPLAVAAFAAGTTVAASAALSPALSRGTAFATSQTVGVPRLQNVRDLGRATASTTVRISVELPYRHAAELAGLIDAQGNHGSPLYRHFLTTAQFRNYFAPTAQDYARTIAALQTGGFHIRDTYGNRTLIVAEAPAPTAERYFNTEFHRVVDADGRSAYANVRSATIPANLGAQHVVGFDTVVKVKVDSAGVPHKAKTAQSSPGPLFGPDGGYGPAILQNAYNLPVKHGFDGRGILVADVIDGAVIDTDVTTFLSYYGQTRTGPPTVMEPVSGGCSGGFGCFDSFQAAIDAEWIVAMAPRAALYVYQPPSLSNGSIVAAYNAIVSDDTMDVVNTSFGGCETSLFDIVLAIEPIIAQGTAQGISFENVAFGGANDCGEGLPLPQAPADLSDGLAVGGSNITTDSTGKRIAETAFSGSNGGVSVIVPVPAWQKGQPGVNNSGRNVPDIVFGGASDGTGPSFYVSAFGGWVGGSPFVNNAPAAGAIATAAEELHRTRLGNDSKVTWTLFNALGYSVGGKPIFYDITIGCNGSVNGVPSCAKPGYDTASGIGSTNLQNLVTLGS